MQRIDTAVTIIGGGPAGLMLAIELGCRGTPCVLLEEDSGPPTIPKANATSARTMEHYRRRGFADRVRASGLPNDHAQDITYCTRVAGNDLARWRLPSVDAMRAGQFGDYGESNWPTPELPHRGQQMFIEPILLDEARRYPSVDIRLGVRARKVSDRGDAAFVEADVVNAGEALTIQSQYVVGCDGPRSIVREAIGARYEGRGSEDREFLGGQMLTIYFRSTALQAIMRRNGRDCAWQWWIVNPDRRGAFVAISGYDAFGCMIQLRPNETAQNIDIAATLAALAGEAFPFELLATGQWNAGYMLVAEKFSQGRLFIAGDAAHLFTPTGGMGYNTSVDDVVNLGWKLAAAVDGWGTERLLGTYETERRPIAQRNTAFAKQMADSVASLAPYAEIESTGADADTMRRQFGERCLAHIRAEFNIPGLQLGVRYASDIVATEPGAPPPDNPNHYVPSAYPGARAPHVTHSAGGSILDRFGAGFTLLALSGEPSAQWRDTATRLGIPLDVLVHTDANVAKLYGADLVLIRPDHHIAWRGDAAANPRSVLSHAIG